MVLSNKELKAKHRQNFTDNYESYYPVKVFDEFNFVRRQCPHCSHHYWTAAESPRENCGDSACAGLYNFIGTGVGKKKADGTQYTVADAWNLFKNYFEQTTESGEKCPNHHTAIPRYPVVARWRNDVDFVAAGIFCFQPFCVTGELMPPANPLICAQPCFRFNDLDSVGLSGRHYSCFHMIGIQAFNHNPTEPHYWMEDVVRCNLKWLTEYLEIPRNEVTLIEDIWAGGGNVGPSIEYFIGGLELGNMVFMQFAATENGDLNTLPVLVVDTGIGLERIPWLLNGNVTSYPLTFAKSLAALLKHSSVTMDDLEGDLWQKFAPMACQLNMDEVEDIEKTWADVAAACDVSVEELKVAIHKSKVVYTVLDHLRTTMISITDGCLPSNVGGGSNVRTVLRRVFNFISKEQIFADVDLEALFEICTAIRMDLEDLHGEGKFPEHPSFREIMDVEYKRWKTTDVESKKKIEALFSKKTKSGKAIDIDDWIVAITSYGVDPETVSEVIGQPVPDMLFATIAEREEKSAKLASAPLYDHNEFLPTLSLAYEDLAEFEAKLIALPENKEDNKKHNIVVLDRTAFYPTQGGQMHDTGIITIGGKNYNVTDCIKYNTVVFHIVDEEVPLEMLNSTVTGIIDEVRRDQLMAHHSAAHVLCAAARKVLGPHIWQAGAKKDVTVAHLDVTHFEGISFEKIQQIERVANEIIRACKPVHVSDQAKDEAEKVYGFTLYQGGVVPGSTVRVVDIENTDVEACCGTHVKNTGQIGLIRILRANRISDGVVRIQFVAGPKALEFTSQQSAVLHDLMDLWSLELDKVVDKAGQFFEGYKHYQKRSEKLTQTVTEMSLELALLKPQTHVKIVTSEGNPSIIKTALATAAEQINEQKRAILVIGPNFVYGIAHKDVLAEIEEVISSEKKIRVIKGFKVGKKNAVTFNNLVEIAGLGIGEETASKIDSALNW